MTTEIIVEAPARPEIKVEILHPEIVIDAPARPNIVVEKSGIPGPSGEVSVGSTTTLPPGSQATVTDSEESPFRAVFHFGIPEGIQGVQGEVEVGSTTTLPPGSQATVTDSDPSIHRAVLEFGIPEGIQGVQGEVEVGTTTTLPPGSAATVTDSDPSIHRAVLEFGVPEGHPATADAGTTTTGAPGTQAQVTNVGTTRDAVFDFVVPEGHPATADAGTTTTGAPSTQAQVTNVGTSRNAVFDFVIPEGIQGVQGEVAVESTETLPPGSAATVTDSDARPTHASLRFGIPEGHPATADAGTTTTGAPGTPAQVTNVGTSRNAVFDFVVPEGIQGIQGIQGLQGEVVVDSTLTGAAGSSALVEDLDASPNRALLRFTIPQGIQGEQGIQGIQGESGTTILDGVGPPATGLGEEGDYYLDSEDDILYGPRNADGTWPVAIGGFDPADLPPETDALHNTSYGIGAIPGTATGQNNAAFGENALQVLESGSTNSAFGVNALKALTTGGYNMAIGMNAGATLTTHTSNTLIGPNAGFYATSNENTAIGRNALMNLTTGGSNVGIGMSSGLGIMTGGSNVAIGKNTLAVGDAAQNVGIGTAALNKSAGSGNIGVGYQALYNLTTGIRNVALGYNAGTNPKGIIENATTTANNQTIIGYNAGQSSAGALHALTVIGSDAIGTNNATAVGAGAQALGIWSTAIGSYAKANMPGSVAIGADNLGTSAVASAANEFVLGAPTHAVKVPGSLTALNNINLPGGGILWTATDRFLYVKDGWLSSANGLAVLQPFQIGEPTAATHAATRQYVDDQVSGITGGGTNPIGPAGGDLAGSYPNPTLAVDRVRLAGDTMTGKLKIDAGAGAGVPLIELRVNNGTQMISSDANSSTTFSNAISVPVIYTGGIGFHTAGAQVDMNMGTIIQASKFTTTSATGHFRNYSDYNAGQGQADQGIIHTYANRTAGAAPHAAFQVHKSGDITENPFLVSSNGYGWYRNLQPDKVVLALKAASGQTAKVFQVEDPTGSPKLTVGYDGTLNATIVRVPGMDLWNDGRIYFQNQAVWLGSAPGALQTNSPILLPGDPTDPLHAATRAYVDNKTPTLPADMVKGTGVDNQIAVWSGANSIKGVPNFTWDGNLNFPELSQIVMPTSGSAVKGRLQTLPGTPDWLGYTLNSKFDPSGWLLDDTSKKGWFFKLDSRTTQVPEFAVYCIPSGANPHVDEYPVLRVNSDGLMTLRGRITGVHEPTEGTDATTRNYVDTHPWKFAPGVKQLTAGMSLDGAMDTGFYDINAPLNAPGPASWWYVEVLGHSNDPTLHSFQRATALAESGAPVTYERRKYSGVWSNWETILTQSAADNRYVNVDGDTITGDIAVGPSPRLRVGTVWDGGYRGVQVLPTGTVAGSGSALMLSGPGITDPHSYFISAGEINLRPFFDGAKQTTIGTSGMTLPGHLKVGPDSGAVTNPGDLGVAYIDSKYGGSFGGEEVWNVGTPTDPASAANKSYTDTKVAKTGDTMTGTDPASRVLTVKGAVAQSAPILAVRDSADVDKVTITASGFTSSVAATFTGWLTAGSLVVNNDIDVTDGKVKNVATPTDPTDGASKSYVDGRVMHGTAAPPSTVPPAGTIYCQYT